MTFVVTEKCRGCKSTECVDACPVPAFHQAADILFINPNECIDCEACVPVCPVNAIVAGYELSPEDEHYLEDNIRGCAENPVITGKQAPLKDPC